MHERPPAARETALANQGVPRRDEHLGEGSGIGQRQGVGHLHRQSFMDGEPLGVAAPIADPHDEIAHGVFGDSLTNGDDPAGELEPGISCAIGGPGYRPIR